VVGARILAAYWAAARILAPSATLLHGGHVNLHSFPASFSPPVTAVFSVLHCWLSLRTMCCCRVLVAGLFLWSAATAATALPCLPGLMSSQTAAASGAQLALLLLLLGARGLMGLASAAAMPCVTAISAQLVPAADRGSAVSFVYACFNAGGGWVAVVQPSLSSWLNHCPCRRSRQSVMQSGQWLHAESADQQESPRVAPLHVSGRCTTMQR
jgi:MFS family permease